MRSAARSFWPQSGLLSSYAGLDTLGLKVDGESWCAEIDMSTDSPALDAGSVLGQRTSSEEFTTLTPDADDGSQNARGLLVYRHPGGAAPAVVVSANALVSERAARLPAGISAEDRQAAFNALAGHRIVVVDATGEPIAPSWILS